MSVRKNFLIPLITILILAVSFSAYAASTTIKGQEPSGANINLSLVKEVKHSLDLAFKFLLSSQMPNGSWKNDPAITGLVLYSFVLKPTYAPNEETKRAIEKGFTFLKGFVKDDGGIYRKEYRNYVTAVCLMAFSESDLPEHKNIITNAKNFLIEFQADEGEGYASDNKYYGGIGYGGDARPDLSNTQLALDGIKAAENYETRYKKIIPAKMDEIEKEEAQLGLHWKKALIFLARTQNVKAVNNMPYATDDGGFQYETGTYKKERSHSYGSMTYAGLKSLLYARLSRDDIRVQKAVEWISKHYTVKENPKFGNTSLYYYYMTFSKTLAALGEEVIIDPQMVKHYWREDIMKQLLSLQAEDGFWMNENGRYWENIKDLATAYSIISMKYAFQEYGKFSVN